MLSDFNTPAPLTVDQTYHADANIDPNIYPNSQLWYPGRFLSDRAECLKELLAYSGFGAGRLKCSEWAPLSTVIHSNTILDGLHAKPDEG